MQYNQAITLLSQRLKSSAHNWELAILEAFLSTAFEVMQGREGRAKMHMRSAFAILKSSPWSSTHQIAALAVYLRDLC